MNMMKSQWGQCRLLFNWNLLSQFSPGTKIRKRNPLTKFKVSTLQEKPQHIKLILFWSMQRSNNILELVQSQVASMFYHRFGKRLLTLDYLQFLVLSEVACMVKIFVSPRYENILYICPREEQNLPKSVIGLFKTIYKLIQTFLKLDSYT